MLTIADDVSVRDEFFQVGRVGAEARARHGGGAVVFIAKNVLKIQEGHHVRQVWKQKIGQ